MDVWYWIWAINDFFYEKARKKARNLDFNTIFQKSLSQIQDTYKCDAIEGANILLSYSYFEDVMLVYNSGHEEFNTIQ